ncbi:hypothetical protein C8N46_10329 [Kordia periserrulae]|uniref:Uncharacterized protein n=1 Tax=Kordia periserrulae TaxID=701523 RepID=A0A2T6C0V5_9FLAO|nr:hypothetical protein C8N46_10329 [Kordia periserrulae]
MLFYHNLVSLKITLKKVMEYGQYVYLPSLRRKYIL